MKKILSLILTLALLFSLALVSGCGLIDAFSNRVPTTYSNPEDYTVGNAEFEGVVDTFYLWWIEGSVTVKTHKENTVKIEENTNGSADERFRLRWKLDRDVGEYGNVLSIRYSDSGNFDFGDLKKDITVYLPENDGMDISLTIDAASVEVDTSDFKNMLSELTISTNSGKVSAKIDSADEVRISGQNDEGIPEDSREFLFRAEGTVYDLGISSSYAHLDVSAKSVKDGEVFTVFGDLRFVAEEVGELDLRNSRNKIFATVLEFESLDIETYSESCELTLSPDASFVLSIKEKDRFKQAMSPDEVVIDFEDVTKQGSEYTVGTGECEIEIATDSNIYIYPVRDQGGAQ